MINEEELLDFAGRCFLEGGRIGRWNGRQIRNAFQVARSLAYYEYAIYQERWARERAACAAAGKDDPPPLGPPILDVRHFDTMHRITLSFNNYRAAIQGATDQEMALELGYRDDIYSDPLIKGWQADYRAQRQSEAVAAGSVDGGSLEAEPVRAQRPRQQPGGDCDDQKSSTDNFVHASRSQHNLQHRGSFNAGHQARSRSNTGGIVTSPNAGQPPRYPTGVPVPSPRWGPIRDAGQVGEYPNNYLQTGSSPRGLSNYRLQPQYGNEGAPANMSSITPRGSPPGIGEGGVPLGHGGGSRDYGQQSQQDYYNSQAAGGAGGTSLSPFAARAGGGDGFAMHGGRHGSQSSGSWNSRGGGGGHGRDSISRSRGESLETDLAMDEGY